MLVNGDMAESNKKKQGVLAEELFVTMYYLSLCYPHSEVNIRLNAVII